MNRIQRIMRRKQRGARHEGTKKAEVAQDDGGAVEDPRLFPQAETVDPKAEGDIYTEESWPATDPAESPED